LKAGTPEDKVGGQWSITALDKLLADRIKDESSC